VKYDLRRPCPECPFLRGSPLNRTLDPERIREFAEGEFSCHKTATLREVNGCQEYKPNADSSHCAGALIALEKAGRPHQMMRIAERLGFYDHTKLDMDSDVDVGAMGGGR
jgi:hypothetical protein